MFVIITVNKLKGIKETMQETLPPQMSPDQVPGMMDMSAFETQFQTSNDMDAMLNEMMSSQLAFDTLSMDNVTAFNDEQVDVLMAPSLTITTFAEAVEMMAAIDHHRIVEDQLRAENDAAAARKKVKTATLGLLSLMALGAEQKQPVTV